MPFAKPFVKVTLQGNLAEVDIFNYSFHLVTSGDAVQAIDLLRGLPTVRDDIVNRLITYHQSTAGSAGYANLESVKFAYIGTDGKYIRDAQTANFAPRQGGYQPSGTTTAFTGAAISLTGGIARNPAGRGRYYPPANAISTETGFYITTARQTELAEAHSDLLSDINSILIGATTTLYVGIVSEKDSGAQQAVESVRVGSVLDVQRRRKNRAYETYVNSNLVS